MKPDPFFAPLLLTLSCVFGCGANRGSYDVAHYDGYWFAGKKDGKFSIVGAKTNAKGAFPPLHARTSTGKVIVLRELDREWISENFSNKTAYSTVEGNVDVEETEYTEGQTVLRWRTGSFRTFSSRDGSVGLSKRRMLKLPATLGRAKK